MLWKEAVVAYIKAFSQHLCKGTEKGRENPLLGLPVSEFLRKDIQLIVRLCNNALPSAWQGMRYEDDHDLEGNSGIAC
jgi:hypothetical protein